MSSLINHLSEVRYQPQPDNFNFDENERWGLLRPKYRAQIAKEAHQRSFRDLEPVITPTALGRIPRSGLGRVNQIGVICCPEGTSPILMIGGGIIGAGLFGLGAYAAFRAAIREPGFGYAIGLLVGSVAMAFLTVNSVAAIVVGTARAAGGGLPSVQREVAPKPPGPAEEAASTFSSEEPIPPA